MTQEFHLSITALGSDRYLVRTEDTAMGVPIAEAQVEWPVETWLQLAQPVLDDPLIGVLQGTTTLHRRASDLNQLGRSLYGALFQEESIRESWLRAQGIAQNRHEMLRLRLGLKESRLQRLPWEVIQHDGHPLTTRSNLTFARYGANLLVSQPLETKYLPDADAPLRVLMVLASPQDQDHLKLLQEARHIQELLAAEDETSVPIQLHLLEQPDRSALAQALEQGNYQVLHYAGHSDFGESGGDLSLVNRQTGLTERLSGDDLAGLLVNNQIFLTVFNSCRSGHTPGDDTDMDWRQQNLVQALVNRGVPSVIAMAERIPDEVAISFTRLFYKNLRKGYPIDLSLSRTRQGLIAAFGSDQPYWALPILYLQPDFDGYLTQRDRAADDHLDPETLEAPETLPNRPSDATPAVVAPDIVTATLIEHLEVSTPTETVEEDLVADFVKQLSESPTPVDEPPMPADHEEVLVGEESERAKMAIYDTLPEVPLQEETVPPQASTSLPLASQEGPRESSPSSQQIFPRPQRRRTAEQSVFIWFALGLVGIVGVIGLGALALRWANRLPAAPVITSSDSPPSLPSSDVSSDADALLRKAEQALQQERFADARNDFELALTQELMGNTEAQAVSDAIWASVSDTQNPDLLYLQGRIHWQEIARLGESSASYEVGFETRRLAAQARAAWDQTEDTFLKGRIARGFAHYVTGDWDGAIDHWEAALALHEQQRSRQAEPAQNPVVDPVILHAYAGLVIARTRVAELNLEGLAEDERLATASAEDQERLTIETDRELSIAREAFRRLQELDVDGQMSVENLQRLDSSPETWNNWLWTDDLIREWDEISTEWNERLEDAE